MLEGIRPPRPDYPLAELSGRFRFNTTLFDLLVDGFHGDDWTARKGEGSSALWVLGHLAVMRLELLRTLGVEVGGDAWEELFVGPAAPAGFHRMQLSTPRPDELVSAFRAADRPLVHALCEVTAGAARAPWAPSAEGEPITVGGCASFFFFDETFHLGQLALLRQQLGKKSVP